MKILHKILAGPAVAIAFLLAVGVAAHLALTRQGAALEELATRRMARLQASGEAVRDITEMHSGTYRLLTWMANYDEAKVKAAWQGLHKKAEGAAASLAELARGAVPGSDERKLLEQVAPLLAKYRAGVDKSIDLATVDVAMGMMAMQAADAHFGALSGKFDELVDLEKRLAHGSHADAAATARTSQLLLALLVGVAALAAMLVAWRMAAGIVRPVRAAVDTANRIADGDLTVEVRGAGSDETGELLRALAAMNASLRGIVRDVCGGARQVADTSAQIAQGNSDLSQRTEEQASTLEETASSMEELTSTVSQNADNARQASQLAGEAMSVARRGGEVVAEVVVTMTGITESSRRISDIIGVIDGIAFQTNILALNAAVEAARAGEQGRGFAVVASEVRRLAQRCSDAAREIRELIGDSSDKVANGQALVQAAGRTMADIVGSVSRVNELVAEIAAASQEQSSGIEQVNTAIGQMDQVVQQNAALVEEASAAAESMRDQAAALLHAVSRFRVGAHDAPAAAAALAPGSEVRPLRIRPPSAPDVPLEGFQPRAAAAGASWREF